MLQGVTDLQVRRIHPAWWVAAVTFLALVGAAGFRSVPGVFMDPLHQEFGWSVTTISTAFSVNMALYGLTSPFAAALMERFGIRAVVTAALLVVASGSGLTVFMTASWQLVLCWGVLVGLGTGSMALALVATVTGRWFVTHRGLVSGVLTAGGAAGQLVFLPLVAAVTDAAGWRVASLGVAAAALAVAPLVVWLLRDRPSDVGVAPYGGTPEDEPPVVRIGAARVALRALADAVRTKPFWYLAGGMAICGATTFGLIQPHFVPAAHDHGLPITVGAGLLAARRDLRHRRDDRLGLAHRPRRPAAAAARLLRAARAVADGAAAAVRPVRRTRRCCSSSCSTASTGWRRSRRRWRSSASTTAPAHPSCSGGCSRRTRWARP